MIDKLLKARMKGTPLVAINTSDPRLTIDAIVDALPKTPVFEWDSITGIRGNVRCPGAQNWCKQNAKELSDSVNAIRALELAHIMPPESVFFLHNAHAGVDNSVWRQGVWNLRDAYKSSSRMLILLAPSIEFPAELANDVYVIDESLPTPEQLHHRVDSIVADVLKVQTDYEAPPETLITKAVDALCGLSMFSAEQCVAMSLYAKKESRQLWIKLDELWDRKRRIVEATPGLSVWRGNESFDKVAGLSNVKNYLRRVLTGPSSPRCIVFLDEGEKMWAGATGSDSSGVSQGLLGTFLSWMEDSHSDGLLLVGCPGAGKSALAKASGSLAEVPVVSLDMNACKGGYVGDSERNIRMALKVISSISQGQAYFIMTCNKLSNLPPELRRRFPTLFFVDLPSADDKLSIWPIHLQAFGLSEQDRPDDTDWTGADVRNCCKLAAKMGAPLKEAAAYITPVGKTSADLIQALRAEAHGKYLDASKPGLYQNQTQAVAEGGRKLMVGLMEDDADVN